MRDWIYNLKWVFAYHTWYDFIHWLWALNPGWNRTISRHAQIMFIISSTAVMCIPAFIPPVLLNFFNWHEYLKTTETGAIGFLHESTSIETRYKRAEKELMSRTAPLTLSHLCLSALHPFIWQQASFFTSWSAVLGFLRWKFCVCFCHFIFIYLHSGECQHTGKDGQDNMQQRLSCLIYRE